MIDWDLIWFVAIVGHIVVWWIGDLLGIDDRCR